MEEVQSRAAAWANWERMGCSLLLGRDAKLEHTYQAHGAWAWTPGMALVQCSDFFLKPMWVTLHSMLLVTGMLKRRLCQDCQPHSALHATVPLAPRHPMSQPLELSQGCHSHTTIQFASHHEASRKMPKKPWFSMNLSIHCSMRATMRPTGPLCAELSITCAVRDDRHA